MRTILHPLYFILATALCHTALGKPVTSDPTAVEGDELSIAGLQDNERPLKYMFSTDRLSVGISYSALVQGSIGDGESGASGELALFGQWVFIDDEYPSQLLQRIGAEETGLLSLKFKLRQRHALLEDSTAELSGNIGSFLGTTDGFSDRGLEIPELYIQHIFHEGKVEVRYGQISVESRLDGHALRGAKKYFLNRVFSTNPTVAFPRFGAGATARWQYNDQFDFTYALTQVQASKTGAQVDFELDSSNVFTAFQSGFTWLGDESENHIQAMVWASDATDDSEEDYGVSLGFEHHFDEKNKSLFLRFSSSNGSQTDLDQMAVVGFGASIREDDLIGFGVGAGRSSDTGVVQGVLEGFYRYQTPYKFSITPDLQLHLGKGLRGDFSVIAGVRAHIEF
jgi:hypothetical protein